MSQVIEDIPGEWAPAAEAALAWVNASQERAFKLTGLVLAEGAQPPSGPAPVECGLVLCQEDFCSREQVRIRAGDDGFEIELVPAQAPEIPPLLDPPAGVRSRWLDQQLEKYRFVVLLYYRGLW